MGKEQIGFSEWRQSSNNLSANEIVDADFFIAAYATTECPLLAVVALIYLNSSGGNGVYSGRS